MTGGAIFVHLLNTGTDGKVVKKTIEARRKVFRALGHRESCPISVRLDLQIYSEPHGDVVKTTRDQTGHRDRGPFSKPKQPPTRPPSLPSPPPARDRDCQLRRPSASWPRSLPMPHRARCGTPAGSSGRSQHRWRGPPSSAPSPPQLQETGSAWSRRWGSSTGCTGGATT